MKATHSATWWLLALALAALIFWWPCLVGGKVPVAAVYQQQMPPFGEPQSPAPRAWDALLWDSMAQFYPWRLLLQRGLRSGELPLWNPHQYCGYPFVGNGQSAIFYPPNWLLLVVDTKYFLGLSLALHWFLAGMLTFFLARTLGLRPAGAALAGMLYQSSGFMITWCELPTVVNSMAWLPGAWLGVELLFRLREAGSQPAIGTGFREGRAGSPPHAGIVLLAASLGLCLLAGHLQFAAYVWLTTAAYALARTLYRWFTRRRAPVLALALAVILGLGMGMPQVLPSLELGRYSPRGETKVSAEGWRFQQQRALQPMELLTFLWPEALGDPVTGTYPGISFTEHCGYAGVLALLLALLGVTLRRDRWAGLYGVGAVAAVSLAMAGPLAWLLYYGLPMLGLTGGFARILGVYTLCLAVLAGMGLDAVLAALARRGQAGSQTYAGKLVAGVAVLVVAAELFPWGWRFLPLAPQEQVYPDTALTRLLQAKGKDPNYRVLCITPRANWTLTKVPHALLPPNAATVYGWYSPDGYDSLSLTSYRAWATRMEGADVSPVTNGNMMLLSSSVSARWVVSSAPLSSPLVRLRARTTEGYVHESPATVLPGGWGSITRTINTISMPVDPRSRIAEVGETWFVGWRADHDSVPVPASSIAPPPPVGAAGGGASSAATPVNPFIAVQVPPGTQQLWLAFYPESVVVGLYLGMLSLAVLAGLVIAARRQRPAAAGRR